MRIIRYCNLEKRGKRGPCFQRIKIRKVSKTDQEVLHPGTIGQVLATSLNYFKDVARTDQEVLLPGTLGQVLAT